MNICGRSCETGEVVTLTITGERIAGAQTGAVGADLGGSDVWLSPGFFDIQLNGYGGYDFNHKAWGGADEVSNRLAPLFEKTARSGTALLCPTITTNSRQAICDGLAALSSFLEREKRFARTVPGIHLE